MTNLLIDDRGPVNTQERWLKLLSPERLGASTEHAVGHSPDRSRFQQDYDRIVFTSAW